MAHGAVRELNGEDTGEGPGSTPVPWESRGIQQIVPGAPRATEPGVGVGDTLPGALTEPKTRFTSAFQRLYESGNE